MNLTSIQNFSSKRPCITNEKYLSDEKSELSQWGIYGKYICDYAYVLLNYKSLHVIVGNASLALSYITTFTKSGCFRFRRYNKLQHPWLSRNLYRSTRHIGSDGRWLAKTSSIWRPIWRHHFSFSHAVYID